MGMKGKSVDRPCIRIQRGEIISIFSKICTTRVIERARDSDGERGREVALRWGCRAEGEKNGSFHHSSFFVLHSSQKE